MGKVAIDRPSNYGEIVTLEVCKEIVKLEGGVLCNEEGDILREKYHYDWQKVAHHDEVSKVYDSLHHVVLALLNSGSHGRKSSNRERCAQKRYELCSLLSRLALVNAGLKLEDIRNSGGMSDNCGLDSVQLQNLETLVSPEGRDQLLDPPQSKTVSTNLEIDVFTFYKSDHVPARGELFKPPRILGLDARVQVLQIWDELSEPSSRLEVEVDRSEPSEKVYVMVFEASNGTDQFLKKMAQLEHDLEYVFIFVNQSETDPDISKKVAFAGLSIMGESDFGIAIDVLKIEFLISRFCHIFPRLHQMLKAGGLIYVGHQNSLNFDVRKIARSLGQLGEKIDNLQKGEEMDKFEARILDGIEDQMKGFENRIEDRINGFENRMDDQMKGFENRIEDRINGFENRMDDRLNQFESCFITSVKDLISKTMEAYLGK
ncbi:hypothetical protein KC19_5G109100 [Ceratodon purpureus]|uniref:Uncharacterized protein n=1 Tax=Ceratodon purpureus TaxID=3225 RepID=A0A8T0I2M3_CERPU|nr:hypothetical protein KC19_5G109100 [Ceratodon purpureus]